MERIYILGCGPSLIDSLPRIPKGSLLFGSGNAFKYARLDFWTSIAGAHYEELREFGKFGKCRYLCPAYVHHQRPEWAEGIPVEIFSEAGPLFDPTGKTLRYNSGMTALQIAWTLGFREMTLIGMDGSEPGGEMLHPEGYWKDPGRALPNRLISPEGRRRRKWKEIRALLEATGEEFAIRDCSVPGYGVFPRISDSV